MNVLLSRDSLLTPKSSYYFSLQSKMTIEIGTPRAKELQVSTHYPLMDREAVAKRLHLGLFQDSIQRELAVKGWAPASDPVMAEFITIMIINSKSPEQITSELKELIGDDYDPEFTNWLFMEAADADDYASSASVSLASASLPEQASTSSSS